MTPLRILIVENHADTVKWLKLFLEDSGHSAAAAMTLKEGVHAINSERFDVVISDIGLADGSGLDLLKQATASVYGIAMSGFGMNADSARSRAAGYKHHLLKPFKISELEALLEKAAAEKQNR